MYNKNKNNLIMLILYLVFSIIVWVLPAQIETKLVFQIFMTLMWAYFFIHVFNHQKKLIKTNEGVPALSNLQNWNLQKIRYLKTSIASSFFVTLSIALGITTLVLTFQHETQGSWFESLTYQAAIVGGSFLANILILLFLGGWNRRICSKLFLNKGFAEEVNLKKMNWFFKNVFRINVLLLLHTSIASAIFSIIIYKDIEKNNLQPLNNIIYIKKS